MSTKSKTTFYTSPFGEAIHPWINKPDTKFNEDGLFKLGLRLSGPEADKLKTAIDAAAEAAFDEMTAEMTPGERKKFSVYRPYAEVEDDNGNPTGEIEFDFKQNAKIRLKDGTVKAIKIGIQDSRGKDVSVQVWGGSILRVMYSMRPIKMAGLKQIGVRLDFSMVQVKKLGSGNSSRGFGAVEDGWTADDEMAESESKGSNETSSAAVDGDY